MTCVANSTDSGKACTHSDQCEGACIAESQNAKSGICSLKTTMSGCAYYLDNQRHSGSPKICYD